VSPDGQWLAYVSDESGTSEIYVQSFPKPGSKVRISPSGGDLPKWRRDGLELYYIAADGKLLFLTQRTERTSRGRRFSELAFCGLCNLCGLCVEKALAVLTLKTRTR